MAATPSHNNRLTLTPSNSPFLPRPAKSHLRGRSLPESRLSLKRVAGTTCRSPTGFDTVNSLFAYLAGGAVVVVDAQGQHFSQRFYRARPSAVPVYSAASSQNPSSTPTATTPKANDSRNRVAPNHRESQCSPADWADSPGSRTWTSRERIKAATCLALSRDGKYLAVGETGYAPRVLIFSLQDASSDTPLVSISEHAFGVNAVAWSADSKYLASLGAANDGFLYIWKIDPRTGAAKLFQQNKCTSYIRDMVWMGNSLVTLGLRHVKVWKIEDGPTISPTKQKFSNEPPPNTPTAQRPLPGRNMLLGDLLEATFSCAAVDGNKLIVCTETGDVCILHNDDGQMKLVKVLSLDFSVSTINIRGNVAYIGGRDGHFATLDVAGVMDGRAESILSVAEASSGIVALGFLPDMLVTIDSKQSIDLWTADYVPGQQAEAVAHIPMPGHGQPIAGVQALRKPNKANAAFATWSYSGNFTFWDLDGQIKSTLEVPMDAAELDGELEFVNKLTCAQTTGNGKLLVTADRLGILKVTDADSKECILDTKAHSSDCKCICIFDEDSKFIMACCGRDRTTQLFHRHSNGNIEHFQTLEFSAKVVQVLVPTEDKVITCSLDRTLQVHDLVSKEGDPDVRAAILSRVISLRASPTSMAMSQDNKTIFVSLLDRSICQFDVSTGRQLSCFKCIDEGGVESTVLESLSVGQWAPKDMEFLLGSSNTDKSVRIYDASSGAFLDREWGHTEAINGVCLVDDDDGTRKIVSVGSDGTIMIWALDSSDLSSRLTSRDPSPIKEANSTRPTLRKVLSKVELAEFQRPPSSGGRRSPSRSLQRRSSRLNLGANPTSIRTPTSTLQSSPCNSTIMEDTPSRRRPSTGNQPDSPPPSPKSERSRTHSLSAAGKGARKKTSSTSLHGFGSLNTATEQTCRALRTYRKKLSSSEPITADVLTDLDHELRLTATALGDRAIRSKAINETVLSGLLDEYSERLVTLLDEKLQLSHRAKERGDEDMEEDRRRSSTGSSTSSSSSSP
ncbi:hypothetical protein HRG_002271 [Hirsutella rhossiliensis]|uniref:Mitogen-activated protein kinase-binding protein 1 n=1 Tax=Hirsutella rhossiliensis TaxID=111463 RepID=A0A9P8N595_9HYPO|nr:uncharacterized protein HRG_02271 [Hirsutella rhossiliensis]KAH0966862.1 hypothetical protein HRG_02271 [Hirsutella rhossiliensis]